MTRLTTAQRRVLTERGKDRVRGSAEVYLTSDRRIGKALERRGLVTGEDRREERYWVDPFVGGWRSTTDRWTEYRLTDEGIRVADELGAAALEAETTERYTREEIEAAKLAVQRKAMIELGGMIGPALVSVTADDAAAIAYLDEQKEKS